MNARNSTLPAGARDSHFDETQVHAVIRSALCFRATTNPLPASGWATSARAQPSATVAVETYGTVSQIVDALSSTVCSNAAATYAGAATMTLAASKPSPPALTSHPDR